jgi:hypothetical protein
MGLCTDQLAFTLQLGKTLENLSSEIVDEGYATSHCLNWGSLLQMRLVGLYST